MAAASAAGAQDVTIRIASPGNQGSGTVTSSPAGINCTLAGQGGTGTCSAQFATGTPVTLTAAPAAHNTLGSWGAALAAHCPSSSSLTCQFTAQSGLSSIDLSFTAERYPLTIVGAGIGIGIVEASVLQGPWYGGGLNCQIVAGVTSGVCTTQHAVGLPINLRFNNSGTNTASGVIYTPAPGIMPAAPHTIVAYITAPGFRIVSAGGPGTGRVVASGDAVIDCTVSPTGVTGSCYKDYGLQPQNGLVTLQATPSPGSTFLGWSGACAGTGTCLYNSSGLDIKEYIANFGSANAATFSIGIRSDVIKNDGDGVVTSSPAGIDCTITDRSRTGTCDASFPEGTTVTLTATPAAGNTFGSWVGASCAPSPTCQVTTSSNNLINVAFNPTRATLTIVGAGVGRVRIEGDHSFDFLGEPSIGCTVSAGVATGTCTTQFPVNKRIVLHWENPPSGVSTLTSVGPLTCVLAFCSGMMPNASLTAVATVIAPAFRILTGGGSGQGRVVSNTMVSPIDCTVSPSQVAGKCSDDFGSKELPVGGVVLQATPSPGSRFEGWSGSGGCSGTGTCLFDRTEVGIVDYVATFAQATVSLSIAGAGTGNGVVTSSAGGLTCVVTKGTANASGCSTPVTEGAAVTLTADPQGGSVFAGWTGDGCSGVSLTCTLTLSQTRNIVARFTAPRPGRDVAMALLGGAPLDAEERAQLDRFGNKDGVFNLGDLLALLDRTGEHLTPGTTAALIEAERRRKSTPTTSPRGTP